MLSAQEVGDLGKAAAGLLPELGPAVQSFLSVSRTAAHHQEIKQLITANDVAGLKDRLSKRLQFGTAGLRGAMAAGFNRMNDVTVLQAAQGLCAYLLASLGEGEARRRSVVIGFDGRHNSMQYAHITAAVFLSKGIRPKLFSKLGPTPFVAYGVIKYGAGAGVMVTASHNPKQDNGYKVYAGNGAQIVPPTDTQIADAILANLAPWPGVFEALDPQTGLLKNGGAVDDIFAEVSETYMKDVTSCLLSKREVVAQSKLKVVYTAMHGVGCPAVVEILNRFGFDMNNLTLVTEQCTPDPNFSTVAFPNPEEKGALDLALATAERVGSSLVIANDPDADRFAAAEKDPKTGKWHLFHGDELGVIFAAYRHQTLKDKGVGGGSQLYVCSAVSSRMLSAMCRKEGLMYEETMTGFKWMSNKVLDVLNEQPQMSCGIAYEEALGYALCLPIIADKDGVSAAAAWVEMSCWLYGQGKTAKGWLDELRQTYGYFVTNNSYLISHDTVKTAQAFDAFRKGGAYSWQVGGYKVTSIRDVTTGFDSSRPDKKCTFPLTPTSQMVTLIFENGASITLRTSGTEPKIKWYAEMSGSDPVAAKQLLDGVVAAVVQEILQPETYGFIRV